MTAIRYTTPPVELLCERLADGAAERRIIFFREAYYTWTRPPESLVDDEWSMGVDPVDDGGTHAEWTITWRTLGGKPTWRLEVFGDGIVGVAATDLLALLADYEDSGPDELRAALLAAGWADRTPRDDPHK